MVMLNSFEVLFNFQKGKKESPELIWLCDPSCCIHVPAVRIDVHQLSLRQ